MQTPCAPLCQLTRSGQASGASDCSLPTVAMPISAAFSMHRRIQLASPEICLRQQGVAHPTAAKVQVQQDEVQFL